MFKRRINVALIAALVIAAAAPIFGQQAVKIGVINSQKAFETSAEGKKTAAQLKDRDAKLKSDFARMDTELQSLQAKLGAQRMTMSPEALLQLQNDIDKKTTARTRYQEDASRDIQKFQYDIVQRVRADMVGIVDTVAKEKGLDLVLDLGGSGIVYFNKALDITDEVIKRYDESKAAGAKK